MLKSSYLCIRFLRRTAIAKRAIFEQIYINNTSSTRARQILGNKNRSWVKQEEPSMPIYIGNWQLFRFERPEQNTSYCLTVVNPMAIRYRRYFYNEEFDPGSG